MNLLGNKIRFFWPLVIIIITVAIALLNYSPGTWLTGWDTLHPELNLPIQIMNVIFGVWRQDQGLGAVAAHSHMSELPRLLILWLGSLVLPMSFLRYGYVFLCFIFGPLGVYFFLKKIFGSPPGAFLGSLFYIFNLGTLQHFYVPFEMFPTQYAAIGWLFLFVHEYLFTSSKKYFWWFIFVSILALPMAYASLLWYAYFGALAVFLLSFRNFWKRGLVLLLATLFINSFWILPNGYFLFTHAKDVPQAKINQMFSDEAFLKNKEFGNLVDTAIFKNFLFDWQQNAGGNQNEDILGFWKQHLKLPAVSGIGYISALLVFVGLFISIKKRQKVLIAFFPVGLLALIMIINMNPPFSWVFDFFREQSAIFKESLRFPFTKFSIILIFVFSLYFGAFWNYLLDKIHKNSVKFTLILVVTGSLFLYCLPMFQGYLIDPRLRINIPQEYFSAMGWFRQQSPDGRVAPFPTNSIYGWQYESWGYQGPGFFWFGIPQTFLARDFDRWMPQNENYYWEISQAVYSKNLPLFESVLNKYRINWLLVDENIIDPSSPKALYTNELESMISNSQSIRLVQKFGGIRIYSVTLRVTEKSFVSVAQNLPGVGPSYKWGNLDQAYFDVGDYTNGQDYIYPYRTLFTGRSQTDLEFLPENLPLGEKVDSKKFPTLSHRDAYLIKIKAKNILGKPFVFWIEDLNSRRSVLETYLDVETHDRASLQYFILPPMEPDGLGYSFHLDSNMIGKEVSKNELESLDVYKIDYWGMVNKKNKNIDSSVRWNDSFVVEHPNPSFYKIAVQYPATIILSQSFDNGWVAFGATNHKLINNWANGWDVENGQKIIYLFFWPQLLEFAGFGLLTIVILGMIIILLVSPKVISQNAPKQQ